MKLTRIRSLSNGTTRPHQYYIKYDYSRTKFRPYEIIKREVRDSLTRSYCAHKIKATENPDRFSFLSRYDRQKYIYDLPRNIP